MARARVSAVSGARVKGGCRRSTRNGIITPTAKLRLEKLLHALSLSHAGGTPSARGPPTIPCIGPAPPPTTLHPPLGTATTTTTTTSGALHFIQSFPFPVFVSRPNVALPVHRPPTTQSCRRRRRLSRARRKKLL